MKEGAGSLLKRRFIGFFACLFVVFAHATPARACTSSQIDVLGDGTQCETSKFELTTTSLSAGDSFKFSIAAEGTFYVDCGDGGALSGTNASGKTISKSTNVSVSYTCEWSSAGAHTIKFGGVATEYPVLGLDVSSSKAAINFSSVLTGNATKIASISGSLAALFPQLGSSASQIPQFIGTFSGATNLTLIPGTLFSGLTGGSNATYMFYETFENCTGLTSIPSGLFGSITGAATSMFSGTFDGCTNLGGFIPSTTFAGLVANNSPSATLMWNDTFANTQLVTACTANSTQYITGYEGTSNNSTWNTRVSCECDTGYYLDNGACVPCPAGTYNASAGATSASACVACATGEYSGAGASSCTACSNKPSNSTYTGAATTNTCPWTCDAGYINTGTTCEAEKFTVTTTSDATSLIFTISASGTFYVDCGDGGTLSGGTASGKTITRTLTYSTTYTCSWGSAGAHVVKFGGTATRYGGIDSSAIRFYQSSSGTQTKIASISGSLGSMFPAVNTSVPRFIRTFYGCTGLTELPSGLFSGINMSSATNTTNMFSETFSQCTGLTSIPETLFSAINTSSATDTSYMFDGTFSDCTGLTSVPGTLFSAIDTSSATDTHNMFYYTFSDCTALTSVPGTLFSAIDTSSATNTRYMFSNTFYGCTGLTSLPAGLFSSIDTSSATGISAMFIETFSGCTRLTSIPETLFSGIDTSSATSTNALFYGTFYGCTGLTSLPAGLFSGIDTSSATSTDSMFKETFYGCSNITSYIPPTTFPNTIKRGSSSSSDMWKNTFYGTRIVTSCPSGTGQYITGFESDWGSKVSCEVCSGSLPTNATLVSGTCNWTCDAGYINTGTTCETEKFTLTTTSDATSLVFKITATGTFYVDCGDGGTLYQNGISGSTVSGHTITRTGTSANGYYTCSWNSAGTHTVKFGGTATGYNTDPLTSTIRFYQPSGGTQDKIAGISGSLGAIFPVINGAVPRFYLTFGECTGLTSLPSGLFSGIDTSTATDTFAMFSSTFYGCTGLTSVPSDLFSGIDTSSATDTGRMFESTFYGCTGLTSIPGGLFSSIDTSSATDTSDMFENAFYGCTGLTSLPAGLFGSIDTSSATTTSNMFLSTFDGCTNLTGYIPPTTFPSTIVTVSANTWYTAFRDTNLATSCPSGTEQYITGFESYWGYSEENTTTNGANRVSCQPVCPVGQYGDGTTCTACSNKPSNSTYTGTAATNTCPWTCDSGYYADGNSCTACSAGTYNANSGATSSSSCLACAVGEYSAAGASSCTACTNAPSGATYTSNATSNSCAFDCANGYYADGNSCTACTGAPQHAIYNTNTSACTWACDTGYELENGECVHVACDTFTVTTTDDMPADTVFSFYLSAAGVFNVDWGDGSAVETIDRTGNNGTATLYTHTYTSAGKYTIGFCGTPTAYHVPDTSKDKPDVTETTISFNTDSKDKIASLGGSLGALLPTLNNGASESDFPRFYKTFMGCTALTSIPSELFTGVTGSANAMFRETFDRCSGITSIPSGLFSGATGGAPNMFRSVFNLCTSLTGTIPADLFSNITVAGSGEFKYAFYGNTKMSGYILPSTFGGLIAAGSPSANNMWQETFTGGNGLATSCSGYDGMTEYTTGYEGEDTTSYRKWNGKVSCQPSSCPAGYERIAGECILVNACTGATYYDSEDPNADEHNCVACPSGYTANTDAAKTSAAQCQIACAAGTYLAAVNDVSCTSVGNGYWAAASTVNYGETSTRTACDNKPEHSAYSSAGTSATCPWACDGAYYNNGACIDAGVGYYSPVGDNERYVCTNELPQHSTYSGSAATNNCPHVCDTGYYTDGDVCTVCTNEKPEHSSYTDTAETNACPWACDSTYYNSNGMCVDAGAGYYSPAGDNNRYECTNTKPANSVYSGSAASNACPYICAGATYYDSGNDTCTACPTGYTYNTENGKTSVSQCQIQCAGGYYLATANDESCSEVGDGYWAVASIVNYGETSGRTQCPNDEMTGTHTASSADLCMLMCPGATYFDHASDQCLACPTGYTAHTLSGKMSAAECTISCAGGTYLANANDTTCTNVGDGYYAAASTVAYGSTGTRTQCPNGELTGTDTASSVSQCVPTCTGATYLDNGVCVACPNGYTSNTTDGKTSISQCQISCAAGTYLVNVNDTTCANVGDGYWAPASMVGYGTTSARTACQSGYITNKNNAVAASECVAPSCTGATYLDPEDENADASGCVTCPTGYTDNTIAGKTSVDQCQKHCNAGTYLAKYTPLTYLQGGNNNTSNPPNFIDTGYRVTQTTASVEAVVGTITKPGSTDDIGNPFGNLYLGAEDENGQVLYATGGFSHGYKNRLFGLWMRNTGGQGGKATVTGDFDPDVPYTIESTSTMNNNGSVDSTITVKKNGTTVGTGSKNQTSSSFNAPGNSFKLFTNGAAYIDENGAVVKNHLGDKLFGGRIYSLKLWDGAKTDANLVLDLIPVRRNSDNALGFYNRINDEFYENAGTGTFIAGAATGDPIITVCSPVGYGYYVATNDTNYGSNGVRNQCPNNAATIVNGVGVNNASSIYACEGVEQCTGATYPNPLTGVCTSCPLGYTADTTDNKESISQCKISCAAGTYLAEEFDSECTSAGSGYWAAAAEVKYGYTNEPTACPLGYTYHTATGKTSAAQCQIGCAAGTYLATANDATCTTATDGYYAAASVVNYGSTSTQTACSNKPEHSAYSGAGTSATCPWVCDATYYADNDACVDAGVGYYSPAGDNERYECDNEKPSDSSYTGSAATNNCPFACDAGYYADNNVCVDAGTGYWSPAGDDSRYECSNKPTNSVYSETGTSASCPWTCASGYTENNGACESDGVSCIGAMYLDDGVCVACPTGYTYDTTDGKVSASECQINCGVGTYLATANDATCTNVGAGFWSAGGAVNYGSTSLRNACASGLTTIGYGHGADEAGDCGRIMHIGDYVIYARSTKETTPSINFKMANDDRFYISVSSTDHTLSRLHIWDGQTKYTAYDDSLYYNER